MYTRLASLHFRRLLWGKWPSLSTQFTCRHRGSLSVPPVWWRASLFLLLGGIVSLSQLYDQVATLNGHRIKATSLKKSLHTRKSIKCTHPHRQPVLWQDPFTLDTAVLSLGKAGVKLCCLVQHVTHNLRSTVKATDLIRYYLLLMSSDCLESIQIIIHQAVYQHKT